MGKIEEIENKWIPLDRLFGTQEYKEYRNYRIITNGPTGSNTLPKNVDHLSRKKRMRFECMFFFLPMIFLWNNGCRNFFFFKNCNPKDPEITIFFFCSKKKPQQYSTRMSTKRVSPDCRNWSSMQTKSDTIPSTNICHNREIAKLEHLRSSWQ